LLIDCYKKNRKSAVRKPVDLSGQICSTDIEIPVLPAVPACGPHPPSLKPSTIERYVVVSFWFRRWIHHIL